MALQASGVITLQDIETEFGGTGSISLSEYYAGGAYVPSGAGVPTSGVISLSNFYGESAGLTVTVTEGGNTGADAAAGYHATNKRTTESGYFTLGSIGSRSPASWNGITIYGLYRQTAGSKGGHKFYFILQGNRAQSIFTQLDIQGYGVVASASAGNHGYLSNMNGTFWRWDIAASGWDGSGTRTVTIIE